MQFKRRIGNIEEIKLEGETMQTRLSAVERVQLAKQLDNFKSCDCSHGRARTHHSGSRDYRALSVQPGRNTTKQPRLASPWRRVDQTTEPSVETQQHILTRIVIPNKNEKQTVYQIAVTETGGSSR